MIKIQKNILPAGYQQVEYLESSGTQYIDTGITLGGGANYTNTDIKLEYDAIINQGTRWQVSGTLGSAGIFIGVNPSNYIGYNAGQSPDIISDITNPYVRCLWINDALNGRAIVKNMVTGVTILDATYTPETKTVPINILLFAYPVSDGSVSGNRMSGKMYGAKIYNNETIIRNLVPAKNSSDVLGMYDTVTNTFLTNAGTGTFIAGPDVYPVHTLQERHITDANGNISEAKKVYNGQNLVHLHLNDNTLFTKRITCNGDIGEGVDVTAKIGSIKGNTLVWNQPINFTGTKTTTINGITFTDNGDGSYTANGTATGTAILQIEYRVGGGDIKDHKFYVRGCPPNGSNTSYSIIDGLWYDLYEYGNGAIWNSGYHGFSIRLRIANGATVNNLIFTPQAFDLTAMFGSGKEPTIEEFKAMFPEDYYPYSEPKLLSFCPQTSAPVTNLIDGDFSSANDWDAPIISTIAVANNQGTFTATQANTQALSLTQALGNIAAGTYYVACKIKSSITRNCSVNIGSDIITTDAVQTNSSDFTIVDTLQVISSDISLGYFYITLNDSVIANEYAILEEAWLVKVPEGTTKAQAREMVYNGGGISASAILRATRGEVYDDISLPISTLTGKLNGEGESVVIFPDGLRSAGSVYDEIVGNKAINRIGSVDLGTLTWYQNSDSDQKLFFANAFPVPMFGSPLVCDKQPTFQSKVVFNLGEGVYSSPNYREFYYYNATDTTASAVKTKLSGSILYYVLNGAREYILDDFQLPINYNANGLGTEEIILEGEDSPATAPANMGIEYRLK